MSAGTIQAGTSRPDPARHVIDCDALAERCGLDRLGVTAVEVFDRTRRDLDERKEAGLQADMQFTYRNPARSTEPDRILEGARTMVVAAKAYAHRVEPPPAGAVGRVARYAGGDHYSSLRTGLEQVAEYLEALGGRARVVFDDNAMVDREAARRAGLGSYGKNSNMLIEGAGSWFVLGAVVTDLDLVSAEPVLELAPDADPCGSCRRCMDACPTGAIVAEGVVDARRCLAWLVQARGTFPAEFRNALGDRIYGCDTCQEVCPENRRHAVPSEASGSWVDVISLLDASDEELLERHGSWYIADRDPGVVRRNALIVLGNVADPEHPDVDRVLRGALRHDRAMIRAHAVWAARRMGRDDLLELADEHPEVLAELRSDVMRR